MLSIWSKCQSTSTKNSCVIKFIQHREQRCQYLLYIFIIEGSKVDLKEALKFSEIYSVQKQVIIMQIKNKVFSRMFLLFAKYFKNNFQQVFGNKMLWYTLFSDWTFVLNLLHFQVN